VYHRFGSRDQLAAALWMRTVERFDAEVVSVLAAPGDPTEVAVLAARAMVGWTEANPIDALILSMFRREDLIGGELGDRATALGRRQAAAISSLADRLGREPDEVAFAVAGIPMAAVRGPIERRSPIPSWVADAVERAVRAALAGPAPPVRPERGASK
jgi:AcrR family transcriptional regulator